METKKASKSFVIPSPVLERAENGKDAYNWSRISRENKERIKENFPKGFCEDCTWKAVHGGRL